MPQIRVPRYRLSEAGGQERRIVGPIGAEAEAIERAGDTIRRAAGAVGEQIAINEREKKAEADALTTIRERSTVEARLRAGKAAVESEIDDWVLKENPTDAAIEEKIRTRYDEMYAASSEGLTSSRVIADVEGERSGVASADIGAEVSRQRGRRAAQAMVTATDRGLAYTLDETPEMLPALVDSTVAEIDMVVAERPDLRDEAAQEKQRIHRATKGRYLEHGDVGEIQYWSDVIDGKLDALGVDTLAEDKAKATGQIILVSEELTERALLEQGMGELVDNGGTFESIVYDPDTEGLEDLLEYTKNLPESERKVVHGAINSAIRSLERKASVQVEVIEPFAEGDETVPFLPDMGQDSALRAEWDEHWKRSQAPWLERWDVPAEDIPDLIDDKARHIQRTVQGIGFLTPAMSTWVLTQGSSANADPRTLMAIARAKKALGPVPFKLSTQPTSRPDIAMQQAGLAPIQMNDLPEWLDKRLDALGELSDMDPAAAYQRVLKDEESLKPGKSSGAKERAQGLLEQKFAPDVVLSETERKAKESAKLVRDGLEKRLKGLVGANMAPLPDNEIDRIRGYIDAAGRDLEDHDFDPTRLADEAVRKGTRDYLKDSPPTALMGRIYTDKNIAALTEGGTRPAQWIEEEVREGLIEFGYTPAQAAAVIASGRVRLYQDANMDPNKFQVVIDPEEGSEEGLWVSPREMVFDYSTSRYRARIEEERLLGAEKALEGLPRDASIEEIKQAWFMDRDKFGRWSSGHASRSWWADKVLPLYEPVLRGVLKGTVLDPARLPVPEGKLFATGKDRPVDPGISKLFEEMGDDGELWQRIPKFREQYARTYKAKLEQIAEYKRLQVTTPRFDGDPRRHADAEARREVMNLWDREFEGMPPAEVLKFLRMGTIPSDLKRAADPEMPLKPTRGALP